MDFTEINSRGKRGKLLGRIDRKNSRFRTAKTVIIKFGLHVSFVELESVKNAVNEWVMIGTAENHDTAVHIMTDTPPSSTSGRRQPRTYACTGPPNVHSSCNRRKCERRFF
ncbi:hypothetical protein TNCV_4002741 [Trichonephila clavipes]|uniref:Uncharacterized protein n=1 Tax=Trichonephila clavipes TaxID=2585209 RepID=A0A8X6RY00_TRICX|nr:hypothetical protein TNCV_4002741 [Trichonephila clavipes]